MAVAPVSSTQQVTQSAFGLDFQSLLQIILTQLTFQDPLKPVDNAEFVSQLAQFASLQQSQTLNDSVTSLLASQSATQATGLLGHKVDFTTDPTANAQALTGTVQSVTFSTGQPQVTIVTSDGQTFANVSIANISTVQ